ncbi:MAG: ABC transporter ATP-binding protein [Thermodesulfobacteriota bacterium]
MIDSTSEESLGKARDWRLFARLGRYLWPYRVSIGLSTLLLLMVSLLSLIQPYLIKVAIDQYIAAGSLEGFSTIIVIFLLVLAAEFGLKYVQGYMIQRTGQKVSFDLRTNLFSHLQRLPVKFFDTNPVGRLMTRLTTDVENINEVFSSGIVVILGDIFMLVGIVIAMLYLNISLALVTFMVIPPLFGITIYFRKYLRENHRTVTLAIARINSYIQEAVSGAMVSKLFGQEGKNQRKFSGLARDHLQARLRLTHLYALYFPTIEIIGALALALIIWYGGGAIIKQALTFGTLVAFIEYIHKFFSPIRDLSEKYTSMQSAAASAERIFRLLDTPAVEALQPRKVKHIAYPGITSQGLWFSYDGHNPVLKDINFSVHPGETVALVGPTGAGKTTLVNLLVRFYEPQKGVITVGGVNIKELDLTELRNYIGVVFQDPFLFSGDIESNIALGNRSPSAETIRAAARMANLDHFWADQPKGYHHPVSERGRTLSTGQRQLVCFARALAYDPQILILDEATSSVDSETEALIQDAVKKLMAGRTSIVVAHRLSTVLTADRILVLHKGQLVEEGTHKQLWAKNGIYHKLCQLQFGLE